MTQHTMEYNGYLATFEDPPTEAHMARARELIDIAGGKPHIPDWPLDPWPEDPSMLDPNGQLVYFKKLT